MKLKLGKRAQKELARVLNKPPPPSSVAPRRFNQKQEITPGEAREIAAEILAGRTIREVAVKWNRKPGPLGAWLARRGYPVQELKREVKKARGRVTPLNSHRDPPKREPYLF